MAKITIKRRNESERADGCAALYAVINIDRNKIRIPVGVSVTSADWDPIREKIRGRGHDVKDKNLIISNIKAKITDILVRARLTGETLTMHGFLALLKRPAETFDFNEYASRHLDEMEGGLQPSTIRHHKAALKKVRDYAPNLMISDITPEWLRSYARHLRDKLNNNPGTIGKNMSVIRTHYYAAIRAGKATKNPFDSFRIPTSRPAVVFLTEEELNLLIKLYKEDTLPDNEQEALRFFLFMSFTAMHISDARSLQIEQIKNGEIRYNRKKTRTAVNIPLSQPAAKLVEHYRAGRRRGNLFTKLPTDQAFNRIIKRVCKRVGIDKDVSAKTGRHTFATLYYKKNRGDIGTLSKLMGHTSLNTTMIYAHILKDNRVVGVSVFDNML